MNDKITIKITADNEDYKKKINELEPLAKSATDGVATNMTKAGAAAEQASGGFTILKGAMANLVAEGINKVASAITGSLSSAISRVDTLEGYTKTMSNLGFTAEEVATAQDKMKASIEKLPTSTTTILSLQERFAALSGEMENSTAITIALNDATLAGGQGMEKASSACDQWYQIIAAGKPDLESMKIINEAMPAQLDAISKSLLGNNANWQDLYEQWQSGKITTEQVTDAIIKLDQEGSDSMASFAQQAEDATGGIGTAFDVMKSRITTQMGNIISEIGSENITKPITTVTNLINDLGSMVVEVVKWIKKNWDIIAPILTVFAGALAGLAGYYAACAVQAKVMAAAQAILNGVMSANPIMLVVVAVAALAAGLVYAYKKSETFREVVDTAFNAVKDVVIDVWNKIKEVWDTIEPYVTEFFEVIKTIFSEALQFISDRFSFSWETIKYVWDLVQPYFAALWEAIKLIFSVVGDVLGGFFSAAWETIKAIWGVASEWFSFLWEEIKLIFSFVEAVLSGDFSGAWEAIKGIWNAAVGFFSGIWEGIKGVFSGIVDKFRSWFGDAFDTVKEKFTLDNFKEVFTDSIIGGLEGIIEDAKDTAGKVWQAIKDAFSKTINVVFGFSGEGGGGILGDMAGSTGALSPFSVGRISSRYGVSRPGHKHAGVDIAAAKGTPIQSVTSGYVSRVQNLTTGYGKNVMVTDTKGNQFLYAHMSAMKAKVGQPVLRGSTIGYVGSTGNSTGPHLHFEVRQGGVAVNPMYWYYLARASYATGGFPDVGEIFRANEDGPEFIGRLGKQNVVANNLQIIEGIKQGVYSGLINATRAQSVGTGGQNISLTQNFYKEQQSPSDLKRAARKGLRQAMAGGIG